MDRPASFTRVATLMLLAMALVASLAAQDPAPLNRVNPWRALVKLPVIASVAGGQELLVQDEAGNPAQADVFVYKRTAAQSLGGSIRSMVVHFHAHGPAMRSLQGGTRYRTDARGIVRVQGIDRAYCFAIGDGVLSQATKLQVRTVVTVRPHVRLLIEVVDARGRPVPNLALHVVREVGDSRLCVCYTDRIGRCEFRVPKNFVSGDYDPIKIVAGVVAENAVEQLVPHNYFQVASRLLRLQLPPIGSVLVKMDRRGEPVPIHHQASLRGQPPAGLFERPRSWLALQWNDEGALFPFVALNTLVNAQLSGPGDNGSLVGAGPTSPGQRVIMVLDAKPKSLTLTGRLSGEDGKPLVETECYGYLSSEQSARKLQVRTDKQGYFESKLPGTFDWTGPVRIQLGPHDKPASSAAWAGRSTANERQARAVWLLPALPDGELDLGEATIKLAPVLLRGVVRDDKGKPVGGLMIESYFGWSRPSEYRVITAADGSFTLYDALLKQGKMEFQFLSSLWGETRHNHAVIGELAELQVRARCRVQATFDDPGLAAALKGQLQRGGRVFARADGSKKMTFPYVQPGRYTFCATLAGRVVARIEDVEAAHVECNEPTSLQGIKLLGEVQTAALRVLNSEGVPVVAVALVIEGEQQSPYVQSDSRGLLRIPFVTKQRIRVEHRDYRTVEITPLIAPMDVVLQPRARLRVSLPDGLSLPADARVVVGGTRNAATLKQRGRAMIRPDGGGVIHLDLVMLDAQGRWRDLYSQTVQLRGDGQVMAVTLSIDTRVVEAAKVLAEEVRRARGS